MPSVKAVAGVFDFLDTVGIVRPSQWSDSLTVADAIASWRCVLFDLSDDALRTAAIAFARGPRSRFWPSPGELLVYAGPMPMDADDADLAWGQLRQMMERHGSRRKPHVPRGGPSWRLSASPRKEEILWAAIDGAGGWPSVVDTSGRDAFIEYLDINASPDADCEQWWGIVCEKAAKNDNHPPLTVDDPDTFDLDDDPDRAEAMEGGISACGGWRNLCISPLKDEAAHRAAFRNAYRSIRKRQQHRAATGAAAALVASTLRALPGGRD